MFYFALWLWSFCGPLCHILGDSRSTWMTTASEFWLTYLRRLLPPPSSSSPSKAIICFVILHTSSLKSHIQMSSFWTQPPTKSFKLFVSLGFPDSWFLYIFFLCHPYSIVNSFPSPFRCSVPSLQTLFWQDQLFCSHVLLSCLLGKISSLDESISLLYLSLLIRKSPH